MSYTPTEWKSGDVITSEKLNNLEQGVADASGGGGGGGTLVVEKTLVGEGYALGETWQTIYDAAKSGKAVLLRNVYEEGGEYDVSISYVTEVYLADGLYMVDAGNENYSATSANGYPDSSVK